MIIETIKNPIKIIVEPWAWEFNLKPGDKMNIDFPNVAFAQAFLEIHENNVIVFSAPSGATCNLSVNGADLSHTKMKNPAP